MNRRYCVIIILLIFLGLTSANAEALSKGSGYMNAGGTKDVHLLADKNSDIIDSIPTGQPFEIILVQGDWVMVRYYRERTGDHIGWVTKDGIEKSYSPTRQPVTPTSPPSVKPTPTSVYGIATNTFLCTTDSCLK